MKTTKNVLSYPRYISYATEEEYNNASKKIAVVYENGTVSYLGTLDKTEAKWFYDCGMTDLLKYSPSECGSGMAAELLGFLEDTYPEFIEEFENN